MLKKNRKGKAIGIKKKKFKQSIFRCFGIIYFFKQYWNNFHLAIRNIDVDNGYMVETAFLKIVMHALMGCILLRALKMY